MQSLLQKLRQSCAQLLDHLIPPRPHERTVTKLTLEDLRRAGADHTYRAHADARVIDAHIILPYRHPHVQALIQELKYHRNRRALSLAAELLADEILGIASEELAPPLLAPIPMHPERRAKRGHNQTELLCEAVVRILGDSVQYEPAALARIRLTPPQQTLSRTARLTNIKNTMRADPTVVRGRTVIILDDVTTTGATLKEAKRALTKASAKQIHCLALAG